MQDLSTILASDVAGILSQLLGSPTSVSRNEFRYGRRGSLAIAVAGPKRGLWFDHEAGTGGDLIDLIMRVHGVKFQRAIEIGRDLMSTLSQRSHQRTPSFPVNHSNAGERIRLARIALAIWDRRKPVLGTKAEIYLASRGLKIDRLDVGHVLGWDPVESAMLALMTDPVTSIPRGIHRTFLDGNARKLGRKMLGGQGVVRLSPDEDVSDALGICEGVEDGLALLISGWQPVWSATSAGALFRFPVLRAISCLTIFADRDRAGLDAARACAARWRASGSDAAIVVPGVIVNVE
ncbi:toprim domain-containing protein [Hyphomicrobium sp.]|uniref:toprim domain-containing protein n=1 Tax=Hyphomicrobium sp. TaxID=82 RepID=UPI000FB5EB4C|nr:toprim domain-containing protein [Hyphomicrobium sp.]RUO97992.1 MAG: hypothetical protein EKK30_14810 [Hyphomicrobium sp.]